MQTIKKRFIYTGILIFVAGIVIETLSSAILGAIATALEPSRVPMMWAVESIVGATRSGLAPLGAVLLAIGIALHWLRDYLPEAPTTSDPDAEQTRP
ncbi:hypothetical protein [Sinomonas sp. G460-2]|uniref:hypothetical protein n=1 Tax=Sinomonas sp. G460-2 TaxID=3393464 RepID=UPI0039F00E78